MLFLRILLIVLIGHVLFWLSNLKTLLRYLRHGSIDCPFLLNRSDTNHRAYNRTPEAVVSIPQRCDTDGRKTTSEDKSV
jgi:hypothetical protein